ncbi:MAG TPA: RIO1 family regulatory kinase/ATPase [Thermoplasmata archaeon]|nr:RIO1 family regulatory kinase/ATPase [Thermoplasmata archaeon]
MPRAHDLVFPRRRERTEDRRKEATQRKLLDEFFDHATLLAVSRLVNQGQFGSIDFPISTGKEGGVFRATRGGEFRAVKIYRIGNTTFRHLPAYALQELRETTSVRNFAGLIAGWTRREHTILGRLADVGVRSPRPFGHLRNVLVMEFIGDERGAAPRLIDAVVEDPAALYADLVAQVRAMLVGARLVHGDLSPYNTLYWNEHPVLIDVAQAVRAEHPQARELLERDLGNYARFLGRLGHPVEPEEFLRAVGGLELAGADPEAA